MVPAVLGLDIGGANLKAAHSKGIARLVPFPLWKNPDGLPSALKDLAEEFPPYDCLAVTMTGELCDCFESKRQGVAVILAAIESAFRHPIRIWRSDGRFVNLAGARADPLPVAAANWLALATFAGRWEPEGAALLVDIGSTTTDIVPLWHGKPMPRGRTDTERLRCGELVYTGVGRTPVCALLGAEGAAELFATTVDVYLILGDLPEELADRNTADGRPATRPAAHARLARMLCGDQESCTEEETRRLASRICDCQLDVLGSAVDRVSAELPKPPTTVITAGSGEFLATKLFAGRGMVRLSLADKLGPAVSQAACAYAVAILAAEQAQPGE